VLDLGCGPGKPTLYHASLSPDEYRALLVANDFAAIDARMEANAAAVRSGWRGGVKIAKSAEWG
jgi:16S rRNA G1207 methylase RsmC